MVGRLLVPVAGMCVFLLAACSGKDGQTAGDDGMGGTGGTGSTGDTGDTGGASGAPTTSSGSDSTTGTDGGSSGDSSGAPGGVEADCATIFAEQDKRIGYYCDCAVEAGDFPDLDSCLMAYEYPASPECVCAIMAADPANGPAMACQAATQVELFQCVSALDCADMDGISDCEIAAETKDADCPATTDASEAEVEMMCFG